MNTTDKFNYEALVANSLIYVVKEALKITEDYGLSGGHFFNITFATTHPLCVLPDFLKAQYPKEMTIVLQYEFSALCVDDEGFSVVLSFGGTPQKLYIPFAAIKFFIDPSANFGLQFKVDDSARPQSFFERKLKEAKLKKSASSASASPAPAHTAGAKPDSTATVIDFKSLKAQKRPSETNKKS